MTTTNQIQRRPTQNSSPRAATVFGRPAAGSGAETLSRTIVATLRPLGAVSCPATTPRQNALRWACSGPVLLLASEHDRWLRWSQSAPRGRQAVAS